jgi:dienelactone hydrolase
MDQVRVRKDVVYAEAGGSSLKLDLYQPPGSSPPVIVLIHDEEPGDALDTSKDWGEFTSYGRLLAASGMAAVTFTHRSSQGGLKLYEAAADVDDLIKYVRAHASDLGVDGDRIGVWAFSAGAAYGVRAALDGPPPFVRCVVAYYGALDLSRLRDRIPRKVLNDTLKMFSPIEYLGIRPERLPPILVMRADLDLPAINSSIDRFVEEARARGVTVQLLSHARGHHAFDVLDDDPRSAEILGDTIAFIANRLGVK